MIIDKLDLIMRIAKDISAKSGLLLMLTVLLAACGNCKKGGGDIECECELPSIEVPINIEIEGAWNIDEQGATRTPPPDAGGGNKGGGGTATISDGWVNAESDIEGVDKVRIVVFRRKDTSDGTGTSEPFLYDVRNDQIINIIGWKNVTVHDTYTDDGLTTDHRHRYGSGTLTKVYGYEYRVIAIAYNSTRTVPYAANGSYNGVLTTGEQNWFDLNIHDGLTLDDFKATIRTQTTADNGTDWREYLTGNSGGLGAPDGDNHLTRKVMACPQLFWGYCHIGDKEPIIRFQTTNGSGDLVDNAPLTGLLYRGMAKVVLNITLQKRAKGTGQNIDWLTLMADHLYTETGLSDYDDFLTPSTPVVEDGKYTSIDYINSASAGDRTLTAWILPTRTRLAIRGRYLWATTHYVDNGQLCADNISYGDMGTGIIAADVADNVFTFRRNHVYVLTCSSSENQFNNHEID